MYVSRKRNGITLTFGHKIKEWFLIKLPYGVGATMAIKARQTQFLNAGAGDDYTYRTVADRIVMICWFGRIELSS